MTAYRVGHRDRYNFSIQQRQQGCPPAAARAFSSVGAEVGGAMLPAL